MYRDHFGEFVCGYWDFKGLMTINLNDNSKTH